MNISEALESKFLALRRLRIARDAEMSAARRQFMNYEQRTLKRAAPYFWSRPITNIVLTSSKTLPTDTKLSLSAHPQWECGWFWFEEPVDPGGVEPFAGLLWSVEDIEGLTNNNGPTRGLFVTLYRRGFQGLPEETTTTYAADMTSLDRIFRDDQRFDDQEFVAAVGQGYTLGGEDARPATFVGLFAFVFTALFWIEQTILVTRDMGASRAVRRRLTREALVPDGAIKVITLRRERRENSTSLGMPVDWSCQWIVRGHWRQQFYPDTGERRPLFILPYVKGPEDKPLKAPVSPLFAVTR